MRVESNITRLTIHDGVKGRTTYGNPANLHQVIGWTTSERRIVDASTYENVAVWL